MKVAANSPFGHHPSPGLGRRLGHQAQCLRRRCKKRRRHRSRRGFCPRQQSAGSGTIWLQAYDAVTTKTGVYVQGGGCTTVGVAGLIQSGGFGSFSKHYGTAAAGLLEAEVVTADGKVRIANACTNSDLFWALKGGGGGTFGVVSKLTLRVRDLPELAGGANFTVKASSDGAYRRLIRHFVGFYRDALFNDHWGEQAHFSPDNELGISMVHLGLDTEQSRKVWQPFLDWLAQSSTAYAIESDPEIGSDALPALGGRGLAQRKASRRFQGRLPLRRQPNQRLVERRRRPGRLGRLGFRVALDARIIAAGRFTRKIGQRFVLSFPLQ